MQKILYKSKQKKKKNYQGFVNKNAKLKEITI